MRNLKQRSEIKQRRREDKNDLNISTDKCNEPEKCLEENGAGQEQIGTEEIAADKNASGCEN